MSLRLTLLLSATLFGRTYSQCAPFDFDAPGAPIALGSVSCTTPNGIRVGTDAGAPVGTECTVTCDGGLFPETTGPQYVCEEVVPALGNGCAPAGFVWTAPAGFPEGITCTAPSCESFVSFVLDDSAARLASGAACADIVAGVNVDIFAPQPTGIICSIEQCQQGFVAISSATIDRFYECTADGETSIGAWERSSSAVNDPCVEVVCPDFNGDAVGVANSSFLECETFSSEEDGPVSPSGRTVDDRCEIECDGDLILSDRGIFTCEAPGFSGRADTAVGVWTPAFQQPECIPARCPAFRLSEFERTRDEVGVTPAPNGCTGGRDPEDGDVIPFIGGDRCSFTCADGYVLADDSLNEFECGQSRFGGAGFVQLEGARCVPDATCESFEDFVATNALENIDSDATQCANRNGASVGFDEDGAATVDTVCEVACDADTSFVDGSRGSNRYSCEAREREPPFTGEWRGDAVCDDNCAGPTTADGFFADLNNVPANPANALTCIEPSSQAENNLFGETFEIGTECTVNCLPGFSPIRSDAYTCRANGEWRGPVTCGPNCPSPISIFDPSVFVAGATVDCGSLDINNEADVRQRCLISCPEGFGVRGGSSPRCTSDGVTSEWSNIPACVPVECPPFEDEASNFPNAILGMCNDGTDANVCTFDESASTAQAFNTTCEVSGCAAGFVFAVEPEDRFFTCERSFSGSPVGVWVGTRDQLCVRA